MKTWFHEWKNDRNRLENNSSRLINARKKDRYFKEILKTWIKIRKDKYSTRMSEVWEKN